MITNELELKEDSKTSKDTMNWTLDKLLTNITEDNIHSKVDTGPDVGNEIIDEDSGEYEQKPKGRLEYENNKEYEDDKIFRLLESLMFELKDKLEPCKEYKKLLRKINKFENKKRLF